MNQHVQQLIQRYTELAACAADIEAAFTLLRDSFAQRGKLLICGNGGSASDSEHVVGELMKGYLSARPLPEEVRQRLVEAYPASGEYLAAHLQGALPALSLVSQTALLTAYANDVAADMIFAQQVYGYGRDGDVLMGISTSGNSRNVIQALQVARVCGLRTLGVTGQSGGAMKPHCDVIIRVPYDETTAIQERQLPIYHTLCAMLEEAFFGRE